MQGELLYALITAPGFNRFAVVNYKPGEDIALKFHSEYGWEGRSDELTIQQLVPGQYLNLDGSPKS